MPNWVWIFVVSCLVAIPGVLTGGASFITIPLLMHFGLDPKAAVATNKPGILPMTLSGIHGFRRYFSAVPKVYRAMPLLMFVGGIGGAELLRRVPAPWVKTVILGLALVVAVPWRRKERKEPEWANETEDAALSRTERGKPVLVWMMAILLSVYNGMLGPGTLTMYISIFRYRVGVPMRSAIAWGNLMGATGNVGALVRYAILGMIEPSVAVAMAFGVMIGARIGVRLGHRLPNRVLEWLVRIVLVALVLGLLVRRSRT